MRKCASLWVYLRRTEEHDAPRPTLRTMFGVNRSVDNPGEELGVAAQVELDQDPRSMATLVGAGTDLPVERPNRDRLDRLSALIDRDPMWRRED